ncbi:YceI family protein [Flavobacteriaceae bacterium]|nr:YceI family protein [Flavobacteriaceae bacterium]MDB2339894.1 YceI family protein [Flavobacteriaceae bacterium]
MKKKLFTLLLLTSISFTALGQTMAVNNEDSSIHWLAKNVTGQHEGNISIADGNLVMQNNTLTGGNFEVDMNSMIVTDLTGEYKDKLEGHLKSDDFFGVAKFPKANLEITEATQKMYNHYEVIADLTIKGITNSITFDMHIENKTAISILTIDRSKFDIRYGSDSFFDNLGDKTIYDNFEIDVTLKF